MPAKFLLVAPDKVDALRQKHTPEHVRYLTSLKSIVFGGIVMPPSNLVTNDQGLPAEITGTTFIYEAETFEEAEALVHADPFWASGEVWDRQQTKILPLSVVLNKLESKSFP